MPENQQLPKVSPPPVPVFDEGVALAPGYEVLAHVHRSRDTDIYRVWSDRRGCNCVAKVLRPDRADREPVRRRLLREARMLQAFTHPHIVRALDVVEVPEITLVLEDLPGATLATLARSSPHVFGWPELVAIGHQLCGAVGYLHHQLILHLDLKPSNVMYHAGRATVIDLSIARPPGRARRGFGTRRYMAPEQILATSLNPGTDVWGIGSVLFECATGRRARDVADVGEELPDGNAPLPSVGELRALPAFLSDAIDACLDPDLDRRPTVAGLGRQLLLGPRPDLVGARL